MQYLRFIPLGIFFVLALLLATGVFNTEPKLTGAPMLGKVLPEFALPRLDKPQERLMPQLWSGQVVLLNVFATWCEPCKAEHALLMKLAQERRVAIYGIAWRDKPDQVMRWLHEMGNPYQIVAQDSAGKSTVMLGLTGIPESMMMSKKNIVKFKQSGPLTEEVIRTRLIPLIEQLQREP